MRVVTGIAVLLAVLATALVGVHVQAENRRLQYRVWEDMRRRDALEKEIRQMEALIDEALSPRRLLEERDRREALAGPGGGEDG